MSERPDLPRDLVRFWEKLVNMGLEDRFWGGEWFSGVAVGGVVLLK